MSAGIIFISICLSALPTYVKIKILYVLEKNNINYVKKPYLE